MAQATAALLTLEILTFPAHSSRASIAASALEHAAVRAGSRVRRSESYEGVSDLLAIWGPGAPDRVEPMRRQMAAGGHVVALDLAYWQRERKFRVSFDAAHPQDWVMRRLLASTRLAQDGIAFVDAWDPRGPVIVAGIGEKAGVQYGVDVVRTWEQAVIAQARSEGRRVYYRPKRQTSWRPNDVPVAGHGSIEACLAGASAVVTWHSNVAVDAIRAGIPAVCRDGAAAAVCPREWRSDLRPLSPETQRAFLANLAWFQWAPDEADACWAFIREALT